MDVTKSSVKGIMSTKQSESRRTIHDNPHVNASTTLASSRSASERYNPAQLMENMVEAYLKSNPFVAGANYQTRKVPELEVRFGTSKSPLMRPLSKINYDHVVQALYSSGFHPIDDNATGLSILRIQNEYFDRKTNLNKISNIRAEIVGADLIQEYCRTNSLQKLLDLPSQTNAKADKIKFTQKNTATMGDGPGSEYIKPVDFHDFGFRVSYQTESYYTPRADIARKIISNWTNSKKTFRYLNRVRFAHPNYPIFADISIVKKSKTANRGVPVPQYTLQDSGVLTNAESYEIELELDNQRVDSYTLPELIGVLRKTIRIVLGALQETRFPIGFAEIRQVLSGYLKLTQKDAADAVTDEFLESLLERKDAMIVLPKYFVGPSSYTLQVENIVPLDTISTTGTQLPNIRRNYTVTDKADGERRLMYVATNGRIYMITPSMQVIFTGALAVRDTQMSPEQGKDDELVDSLLDGEYISYNRQGEPLNLYMAFDLYYLHGVSVRKEGFYPINTEERSLGNFRFLYLDKYLQTLKLRSITDTDKDEKLSIQGGAISHLQKGNERACGWEIQKKNFYIATEENQIFESCAMLLSKMEEGLFPYNTDGLIFTPASMGVGSDRIGVAGPPRKETWTHSFKWKPPEFNTIDFLVSVQHDKRGQEEIKYLYEPGRNIQDDAKSLPSYKTLILKCGFDPKKHGFLNPYSDVLNLRFPGNVGEEDDEKYKPVVFQPTSPYDPNACFCHVALRDMGGKEGVMMTEEGEFFEGNMILECRYDMEREGAWKWVPLRVRYDKTAELRSGQKNYGNSYHVANSNWSSIHNPVKKSMLTLLEDIPTQSYTQNDVYYNRKTRDTNTQALRNFHNLYVKKKLIVGVSNPDDMLLDFACGKGGDLSKWRMSRLKFVLGLDLSRDNIQNQVDGACSRYLGDCRKYGEANMPRCLFFSGDSGKNIRTTGDAFTNTSERTFVKAIFGQGDKNPKELPPAVFKSFGIGESGFDVGSVQFAIHYFFENELTLHQFLRNVSDCIRIGGHFIGTTYDGQTVFDQLRKKPKGGSWTMMKNDTKIAEITKDYDATEFPDTEESIGYRIQVYQETINQVFPEYLVNFKYFVQLMEQYGFQLVSNEDAHRMGLPGPTGMFEELFKKMMQEIRGFRTAEKEYGTAMDMSEDEKKISFLNRYFVFKKIHTVNTENLYKIVRNRASIETTNKSVEQATDINTRNVILQEPDTSTDMTLTNPSQIHSKKLNSKITIECKNESEAGVSVSYSEGRHGSPDEYAEIEKTEKTPKASILLSQTDESEIPELVETSKEPEPEKTAHVTILPSSQRTILTRRPTIKKI